MIKVVLYVSFLSSAARQQCASPATVSSNSSFLHAFLHFCLAICPLKEVALVIGIRLLTPKIKTSWIWHGVGHSPTRGFVPTTERKVAWFKHFVTIQLVALHKTIEFILRIEQGSCFISTFEKTASISDSKRVRLKTPEACITKELRTEN